MPTLAQRWLEEGKLEGELPEKQEVVIKQLDKKSGLKEQEKDFIRSITDREKLDRVIEELLLSGSMRGNAVVYPPAHNRDMGVSLSPKARAGLLAVLLGA